MPAIIAQLVIRIGRSRLAAPTAAASSTWAPPIAIALGEGDEQDRVRDRHADRHDRAHERLDVERRPGDPSAQTATPASTAGIVSTTASDSRNDWKFAVSSRKMTTTATIEAKPKPLNISFIGATWPRTATFTPGGGAPALRERLGYLVRDAAQVLADDVGRQTSASACML